jgi:SAM-dependent methyltransferase
VDWLLPTPCTSALDVGAGTGALTRKLVERVARVVALEPDPRMLAVLTRGSPTAVAIVASAEDLPLSDGTMDSVMVSSAWHWMDPVRTVPEMARVLRPGGVLGVVWNGPDRSVEWVADLLGRPNPQGDDRGRRNRHRVELPADAPFDGLETRLIAWSLAMTGDQMAGLAGTYSSVITLPPDRRAEEIDRARRRLDRLAAPDDAVVELPMSCRCWRAFRR